MTIEYGDFVRINYIGKVKDNDEVFDTTYEEIAKETGAFEENKLYRPIPIVVGGGHLLSALDDAIVGLDAGDSKTVEIKSENAFGPRNPDLIQLLSVREFKKNRINPYPNMMITYKGMEGKVLTVNSGRVKVDFNHKLAGKDVVYDIEVDSLIEDTDEKIKGMVELHYARKGMDLDKTEISIEDGVANIVVDPSLRFDQSSYMDVTLKRFEVARDIWENIDEIKSVNFTDQFSPKELSDEKTSEDVSDNNEE